MEKISVETLRTRYKGNPRWQHNLFIGDNPTKEMHRWCKEAFGHGDVFTRDGVWHDSQTEEPVKEEAVYFFWGPGNIQFKNEDDMIAFVLRFSG